MVNSLKECRVGVRYFCPFLSPKRFCSADWSVSLMCTAQGEKYEGSFLPIWVGKKACQSKVQNVRDVLIAERLGKSGWLNILRQEIEIK